MLALLSLLDSLLWLAEVAVIVWVVLGWLLALNLGGPLRLHMERLALFLNGLIEPVLRPVHRVLPPVGGLDFSPLILLIALHALRLFLRDITISLI
ncbi:MAG: YggT family protein [Alphaproteobacteria bacterium]|nr:YggT family protein [Alphaproteobacteria bacterium]MDA7982756.1 YggT family protein [Alphaproteobacteria bacterium]MDA7984447.1 YggT family protein [Alphaproteobacteria bacterium]MDA7989299.1 YggT family protein [Alphaproteobacteria bacterium]MDA8001358.1 YggT family protein [Alphaproteobacteria bacterium]